MSQQTNRPLKPKFAPRKTANLHDPLLEAQSRILVPIYDKVELLRRELESRNIPPEPFLSQDLQHKQVKQHFLEMGIDRNQDLEKKRKQHSSQNIHHWAHPPQSRNTTTSLNWKEHSRNRAKSLVNFLQQNKSAPKEPMPKSSRKSPSRGISSKLDKNRENQQSFQPVGQKYCQQKVFQESLKSQTVSVAQKEQNQLRLQQIRTASPQQQSKRYLRKGTRVRQILLRQLKTPDDKTSSRSSMAYLKEYDQWVPSVLVEEKKADLQSLMSIIYGDKKIPGQKLLDINKVKLIYL